jgi:hypothetical protein
LSANFFPDTGVKDFNCAIVDLAGDRRDIISVASGSIVKAIQEL